MVIIAGKSIFSKFIRSQWLEPLTWFNFYMYINVENVSGS